MGERKQHVLKLETGIDALQIVLIKDIQETIPPCTAEARGDLELTDLLHIRLPQ